MDIEKIAKYFNVSVEEATKRTIVQHETHTEIVCFIQDNGTLKPIEVITDNGISACCYDKTDEDKKHLKNLEKHQFYIKNKGEVILISPYRNMFTY